MNMFSVWDIMLPRFSVLDLWWPQTLINDIGLLLSITHQHEKHSSSQSWLRFYKVFTCEDTMTFHLQEKTIGSFVCNLMQPHTEHGYNTLTFFTSDDLWLQPTKYTVHLHTVLHPHAKYENHLHFLTKNDLDKILTSLFSKIATYPMVSVMLSSYTKTCKLMSVRKCKRMSMPVLPSLC